MLDFRRLALETNEQLARRDIIDTHLACAVGLPGSEKIDRDRCVKKLNGLVPRIREYTARILARGTKLYPDDTEARIRVRAIIQALWRGAGIQYNRAKIPEDALWDLEDSFVHGAIYGPGGTCATLPIIYVALGRRLGYPLKLVTSWGPKWNHKFCRWDDPTGERFNIDANDTGVSFSPDDYYRHPQLDPKVAEMGRFLESKTPREELASFLACRAHCWRRLGRLREAVDAFAWAAAAAPETPLYLNSAKMWYNDWMTAVDRRKPAGFPTIWLKVVERRYPDGLPFRFEQDVLCLESMDSLLSDTMAESRWRAAMRQGLPVARRPEEILVDSNAGSLAVAIRLSPAV
jgi:hypothetical protein